ncbi:MAG: TPM domain-containing protein [Ruminococcus sp.]
MNKSITKRIFISLLAILMLAFSVLPVSASDLPKVVDNGWLLSDSDAEELSQMLNEISEKHQCDVVIVTTDDLEGKTATEYADDFYDYNGYGYGTGNDGILLLVSLAERDYAISTTGSCIYTFTDSGLDYIEGIFIPYLSDGDYMEAFTAFAQECDNFLTQDAVGDPYDTNNMPEEKYTFSDFIFEFGIALAVGIGLAFVIVSIMKSQLKSVRFQAKADNYLKQGSLNITESKDIFLYSHVTRTPRPKENSGGSSTHTSSSGTTHGGTSGKF